MTPPELTQTKAAAWRPVDIGDDAVAIAERDSLGTTARIAVWPAGRLSRARAAVDQVLAALDLQASRFRPDSEISWLHRADGGVFLLSDGLAEAVAVALAAARWTGGRTDPTVGAALTVLGYDRDFSDISLDCEADLVPSAAPGWRRVELDGRLLRLPPGVRLDLGATAKAVGSDRAARAAESACGHAGGVLVSLGGDIAVAGRAPAGGWPVTVSDGPGPPASASQQVRLARGAVATSSVTCRRWRRSGQVVHHIVDPRTGLPARGPWRTVSAAASTCADANAATTAAIVAGGQAEDWLAASGLPARLVAWDGQVRRVGGWPAGHGQPLPARAGSHVYGACGPARGTT